MLRRLAAKTLRSPSLHTSGFRIPTGQCNLPHLHLHRAPVFLGHSGRKETFQLRSLSSSKAARSSSSSSTNSKSNGKSDLDPSTNGQIQARPPGEKEIESKFPLPDRDKERELSGLQNNVQDLYKEGDYTRALESAKSLLDDTESHFGKDHPATAAAYNNIGLMQKLLGDFDASRKQYQTALKIYKTTVGTDHASYASILHNLGNLNLSQIHFDASLRATDRLSLVESALEYLEQAYTIRKDEMGPEHPHTVASRSSWGTTLATQILHHHKMTTTTDPAAKRQYISLLPAAVAQSGWEAAQEHLQAALQTAIDNPRGPSLQKRARGKNKNKKPSAKQAAAAAGIQTISAASAGFALAVFLKTRATTVTPYNEEWLQQAHTLYQDVLAVRTQLLPAGHPELYAAKYSLAELLETLNDEEGANAIRQEIIDTYDPTGEDDRDDDSAGTVEVTQSSSSSTKQGSDKS
jgi:tetratricopeptide (TPR) repeat protein